MDPVVKAATDYRAFRISPGDISYTVPNEEFAEMIHDSMPVPLHDEDIALLTGFRGAT
jgi:hypothetical protein